MKKNKNQIQQGDVTIERLSREQLKAISTSERKTVSKGRCVLAEGEVTGHAHVIEDEEAELIQVGERMLLSLGRPATLKHEEHAHITLDPGVYEIGRIAEYDYFAQMARNVAD